MVSVKWGRNKIHVTVANAKLIPTSGLGKYTMIRPKGKKSKPKGNKR